MWFRVLGSIRDIQTVASGRAIRELRRLRGSYGGSRWRKRKGNGTVEFGDGSTASAELHWHEAHGIGVAR